MSESVVAEIEDFCGRPVGDLVLRGRSTPLRAYEPLPQGFDLGFLAAYAEAFAKLESGDSAAIPAFAVLVGQRSDDALVSFHLKRLLNGSRNSVVYMD